MQDSIVQVGAMISVGHWDDISTLDPYLSRVPSFYLLDSAGFESSSL